MFWIWILRRNYVRMGSVPRNNVDCGSVAFFRFFFIYNGPCGVGHEGESEPRLSPQDHSRLLLLAARRSSFSYRNQEYVFSDHLTQCELYIRRHGGQQRVKQSQGTCVCQARRFYNKEEKVYVTKSYNKSFFKLTE